MGRRIGLSVGFGIAVVLMLWLVLRGHDTDESTVSGREPDSVRVVRLRGRSGPDILAPAREDVAADHLVVATGPHMPRKIDDMLPVVSVSGRVLLAGSDAPVEGASVAAWTVEHRERTCEVASTDVNGRFHLARVPSRQPVWIVAKAAGWHAVGARVMLSTDDDDHVIHVGAGGTLEGRVTKPDGSPAAAMQVWLVRPGLSLPGMERGPYFDELRHFYVPRAKTDANGAYAFRGVPLDTELLPAVQLSPIAEATGDSVRFVRNGEFLHRDIPIPELASLTVTVFDAEGQVLADGSIGFETARIHFMDPNHAQRLDDGSVRVDGMAPGTWTVRAHIPGAGSAKREVVLQPGADATLEVRPDEGAALAGQVVDSAGRPVEGASVSFYGPAHRSAGTDEEGRFRFTGLPVAPGTLEVQPGDHRLTLEQFLEGRVPVPRARPLARVTLTGVSPGGEPLRVMLPDAGKFRGSFVGIEPGTELRGLLLTPKGSSGFGLLVSADGSIKSELPRPGLPFLIKFTAPDGRYWLRDFEALQPGQDLDLGEIVLEKGVELEGLVLGERGGVIENARVCLTQRWTDQKAWTDQSGAFHFPSVPRRPVYVRVDAQGYPPAFRVLDVRVGARHPVTLAKGGVLELRVLDADGARVSEGTITIWWSLESTYGADLDGLFDSYKLDSSGTTRLRREAATYRVGVWGKTAEQSAWIHPEIREGETTAVEVRLQRKP